MTDKQRPSDKSFYDVSFDAPPEAGNKQSTRSAKQSARPRSTKWDNFYERYRQSPEDSIPPQQKTPPRRRPPQRDNEWQYIPDNNETLAEQSAQIFHRSVDTLKSVTGMIRDNAPKFDPEVLKSRLNKRQPASDSPAKQEVMEEQDETVHTMPDRAPEVTLVDTTHEHESYHTSTSVLVNDVATKVTDFVPSREEKHVKQPTATVSSSSDTPSSTPVRPPLPSREAILRERERRRRLRVQELERLSSAQDIEHTHTPLSFNERGIVKPPKTLESQHESEDTQDHSHVVVTDSATTSALPQQQYTPTSSVTQERSEDHSSEVRTIAQEVPEVIAPTSSMSHTSTSDLPDTPLPLQEVSMPTDDTLESDTSNANIRSSQSTVVASEEVAQQPTILTQEESAPPSIWAKIAFVWNVTLSVLKRLFLYVVLAVFLFGALGAGIGAGYFANLVSKATPPSREEMLAQINQLEQLSTLYYANGEPIANVRADIVRSNSELADISPFIQDGIIATEDEYFYEHSGVVPKAIVRATLQSVLSLGAATGGSTLTQQLVKQQLLTNDVTFLRKANEILLALRLENFFSKEEILTAYLNVSPFGRNNSGENVAGIAKAAEGLFGKSPKDVNLAQAAFLVGLPQDPYTYTPYDQNGELKKDHTDGINRMKEVLFRMYRNQKITKAQYDEALNYNIVADFLPTVARSQERQTYLYQAMLQGAIEQLMRLNIERDNLTWEQVYADDKWYNDYYAAADKQLRTGGYKVYTTIDKQIYDQLQTSAKAYVKDLGVQYDGVHIDPETGQEHYYVESVQNGLVLIDNATGRVLGFVAGTDYETNNIDHAFSMRRSPGSTIKPLAVYAPAIEENIIQPSTVIPDTVFTQTFHDGTTWNPTNYGNTVSGGAESARVALYKSDNLPAIRVYQEMLNRHVDILGYLQKMGFNTASSYTKDDVQNLAFSIGGVSAGPTVFEETRAFSTFANNGQYVPGYYIERIEDAEGQVVFQHDATPTQVFSEDTNYLMVDILRDTMTEGTGRIATSYMEIGGDWIAKTGISENSKDVWMIASTPSITIGSWIGYDSRYQNYTINIEDSYGRESERSQLYWARIVNDLYKIRPDIFGVERTFSQPDSVQETAVLQSTGTLPGVVALNNGTTQLTGPLYNDVFKKSYPAKELTRQFLFGATEEELNNFWATYRAQIEEQRRREEERRRQQEASSSDSSSSSSGSESSSKPEENQTASPEAASSNP